MGTGNEGMLEYKSKVTRICLVNLWTWWRWGELEKGSCENVAYDEQAKL